MYMSVIRNSAQYPAAVSSRTFDQQRDSWNAGGHDYRRKISRYLAVFDGILPFNFDLKESQRGLITVYSPKFH